jgi:hypothetical protein
VIELLVAGFLEGEDLTALGIHPRHDVFDDSVLSCRIHRLQNHEHRVHVRRPEPLLRVGERGPVFFEECRCARLQFGLAQLLEYAFTRPRRIVAFQSRLTWTVDLKSALECLELQHLAWLLFASNHHAREGRDLREIESSLSWM